MRNQHEVKSRVRLGVDLKFELILKLFVYRKLNLSQSKAFLNPSLHHTVHNFCLTLTHHRINIKSQQFLVKPWGWRKKWKERFLWPIDFTLHRVIYQTDLLFYESIDTSMSTKEDWKRLKRECWVVHRQNLAFCCRRIVSCFL